MGWFWDGVEIYSKFTDATRAWLDHLSSIHYTNST